jgi:tetraacyldisaccharide 4'-kinase
LRAGWLETRDESWLRRAALAPLVPVGWAVGAGASLHRALYRAGWWRAARLAGHVVSVGNLVVGGTAKTPAAAWVASALHGRGRKVVLASRGYGVRRLGRERVHVVSDGRFARSRAELAGDEPMLLAALAPGVPVLAGRDRALVGLRALSAFGADVLVLDDGFQHHRLHRDLDVLTVDGAQGFGNRRVLPRGPLREPLSALRHADAVGVVDGPLAAADEALLARLAPGARRFAARRAPLRLRPLAGGRGEPPDALAGAALGLLSGLARPASLRRSVEALGARVVAERRFADHHRYRARDLRDLSRDAPLWITTEKDALKITPSWLRGADVRVLSMAFEVDDPETLLDWIESRLR